MSHYKFGTYGIYKGQEYRVNSNMNDEKGVNRIYTTDLSKTDEDFEDVYGHGVYSKKIQLEDLEEYYDITTYAIWNGMKFLVIRETEDIYCLYTGDSEIAGKYGFEVCNRAEFRKEVSKESVELVEEREDLM